MRVLVVFDHPRRASYAGALLDAFVEGLGAAGHAAEVADLYREGFDPRMDPADEPDWDDPGKRYSAAVLAEQARVARAEALAFVFPVWWWSVPAMTKGWIDRVWNHGWAYGGGAALAHRKALMIGAAAADAAAYAKRGYGAAMQAQLVTGVLGYCGIAEARLVLIHDTTSGPGPRAAGLDEARRLGSAF